MALAGLTLVGLTLAACGASDEAEQAAIISEPAPVRFVSVREIEPNVFVVVHAEADDAGAVEAAARAVCGPRPWCRVMGWTDPGQTASVFPAPADAVRSQTFELNLNRAGAFDRVVWLQ